MKKLFLILALIMGLGSCGAGGSAAESASTTGDRVEVIYFHGKQRCATCVAIEKNAEEVVNTQFADEVKSGKVIFRSVDISSPEGEKLADHYEVTWSSLFINSWKDGKETRNNMTEFGFGNARKHPEEFKKGVAEKIHQSLK